MFCGASANVCGARVYVLWRSLVESLERFLKKLSTPSRTRTCDLRIRNPLLYPAELSGQRVYFGSVINEKVQSRAKVSNGFI